MPYAAAAAALTAGSGTANAGMIYVPFNQTLTEPTGGGTATLDVDVDGGGFDFTLRVSQGAAEIVAVGPDADYVLGSGGVAEALSFGTWIGPDPDWGYGNWNLSFLNNYYVGLSLFGSTHYGWARITAEQVGGLAQITLYDAAYESVSDAPTFASSGGVPEPGSLGILALGAAGLAFFRRSRKAS